MKGIYKMTLQNYISLLSPSYQVDMSNNLEWFLHLSFLDLDDTIHQFRGSCK